MNANLRTFALWVIIVLLLLALFTLFQNPGQRTTSTDISFSQLLNEVDQGRVRDVVIQGPEIHGQFTDGRSNEGSAQVQPEFTGLHLAAPHAKGLVGRPPGIPGEIEVGPLRFRRLVPNHIPDGDAWTDTRDLQSMLLWSRSDLEAT